MEKRGVDRSLHHRLVWIGTVRTTPQLVPTSQLTILPNRIEILDDNLFQSRLAYLSKGFQFDTPLRIEPDFTLRETEALRVAEELPPLSSPSVLCEKPRALVRLSPFLSLH